MQNDNGRLAQAGGDLVDQASELTVPNFPSFRTEHDFVFSEGRVRDA